ncbi:adenylate kinase 9-like protein [Lasius niger]|uniref:Adenylate kinase 9-like protein n=1 Tax=Lasius niger TaxID=67767 RepID=A0A0J7MTI7_LASNI|nr:adenylate kinase 9-like protein [Lasius niger]
MEDLFDIAHANALEIIKIEEDRQFLISQRQKGRIGVIRGIDKKTAEKEERVLKHLSAEEERRKKFFLNTKMSEKMDIEELSDSFENEISFEENTDETFCPTNQPDPFKPLKRGNINFITTKLVAALDKCKLSDRNSVHILMATAEALGHKTEDLVINRTSIRRCRQKLRTERTSILKNQHLTLHLEFAVVHWDGKLLPAITRNKRVDKLPVIK